MTKQPRSPACAPSRPGISLRRWLLTAAAAMFAILALFYSRAVGGI